MSREMLIRFEGNWDSRFGKEAKGMHKTRKCK